MAEAYSKDDLDRIGRKWIERITAAGKREKAWLDDAEKAEAAYLCDGDLPGEVPDFNILHSNVETIVPSIYNSTPQPDIRPRHNNKDPIGKVVSDILERAISAQIDDNALDEEVEYAAQDTFLAGRGGVRIKFDADVEEAVDPLTNEPTQTVQNERVIYENFSWKDYREGPAKRWGDVPWIAYRHEISEAEREQIEDPEIRKVYEVDGPEVVDEDKDVPVWEIWCKETRTVKFIIEDSCRVLTIKDDPLGLSGFFPQPQPMQPITGTGRRTPVCPYKVYKTLADELDKQTRRINKIITGLKVRGLVASDAEGIEDLAQAGDNELVPVADIENLVAAGGLEKAVMWWPIETAVAVLRELYAQREQTKQAIYEITGISDIIRGQGNASETATAQQIKTEWGSLRVKKMQRLVERHVRDLMKLTAEVISLHFSPQALSQASGMEVPQEAMQLLSKPLNHYRIDVESDSTVRADLGKNRKEMGEFLQGTAQFFQTMAPIVQQAPTAAGPLAKMYASFARQFSLGKQAEDALEEFTSMAEETAKQPQPNLEMEAQKMESELKQAEIQIKQQELQIKGEELRLKAQEAQLGGERGDQAEQMKAAIDAEKLLLEERRVDIEEAKMSLEKQRHTDETTAKFAELGVVDPQTAQGNLEQALMTVVDAVVAGNQQVMAGQQHLADSIAESNQQIVSAMRAPKEVIKDNNGRPVGVRVMEQ